jgi:hypothetical protein
MTKERVRCAIYTRKSSEEGLEQSFNSLEAQREACMAYIHSQKHEGWTALNNHYDDGGFSGGNMERAGLKKLLEDIKAGKLDTVVVYKVDALKGLGCDRRPNFSWNFLQRDVKENVDGRLQITLGSSLSERLPIHKSDVGIWLEAVNSF